MRTFGTRVNNKHKSGSKVSRLRAVSLVAVLGLVGAGAATIAVSPAQAATTYTLSVSKAANRSAAVGLNGQTVSGNIYVFTAPASGVKRVLFYLDNPTRTGTATHTEGYGPWDFNGGSSTAALPYATSALTDGSHSITQAVTLTDNSVQVFTANFTVANNVVSGPPTLVSVNPDELPSDTWFVFNRIGSTLATPADYNVHDRDVVQLHNTGTDPVTVSALTLTGPFVLDAPKVTLPATIAPGDSLGVPVKYVAVASPQLSLGSLTVASNDPGRHSFSVTLGGVWQSAPQGASEPTLANILSAFGYKTRTVSGTQSLTNGHGLVKALGDEILSPYWLQADPSKPVVAREVANTHGLFQPAMYWYPRSVTDAPCVAFSPVQSANCTQVLNPPLTEAQTLLPRVFDTDGTTYIPGKASFSPDVSFGLNFLGFEYSDNALNNTMGDLSHNCPGPCGHHVRFYPLKNNAGAVVPNTYLACVEMFGANYDYQDVVVLLSNVKPDLP